MTKVNAPLLGFTAGVISEKGLARIDLDKMRLALSESTNFLATTLGPQKMRPGLEYMSEANLSSASGSTSAVKLIPFAVDRTTKYLVELTNKKARFLEGGAPIQRNGATFTIANGNFGSISGWTTFVDADGRAIVSGNILRLTASHNGRAGVRQRVILNDSGDEHGITIDVRRGPVYLKVGTAAGADDIKRTIALNTGVHSIGFTPTTHFWVELYSTDPKVQKLVDSITVETAGPIVVDAPYSQADLFEINWTQSISVLYLAHGSYAPHKITSSSGNSFGVELFDLRDGPFLNPGSSYVTIDTGNTVGRSTLTASESIFSDGHLGSLWRLTHDRKATSYTFTSDNQSTGYIKVTGRGTARDLRVSLTSSNWTGTTVRLKRAFGVPTGFSTWKSFTANQGGLHNDAFTEEVVYYRLEIDNGGYGSAIVTAKLEYDGSEQSGVARVVGVNSGTSVTVDIYSQFGHSIETSIWQESAWSDYRGWPVAVTFHDGRLMWVKGSQVWASETDNFSSYDVTKVGDSAPFNRSFGSGSAQDAVWIMSLQRLVIGTTGGVYSVRSSSRDDPLTANDFTARLVSTETCASIPPVRIGNFGFFAQEGGRKLLSVSYNFEANDFTATDLSELNPDILKSGIKSMAVQHQPDIRIHCVLSNGKVAVLNFKKDQSIQGWTEINTTALDVTKTDLIEDVAILPDGDNDQIHYQTNREINLVERRYTERMAKETEAEGGDSNRIMDCFIYQDLGSAQTNVTGLTHLAGREVVAWADGVASLTIGSEDRVESNQIQIPVASQLVAVGLPYKARMVTPKLTYGAEMGTALSQRKRVPKLGMILSYVILEGIRIGARKMIGQVMADGDLRKAATTIGGKAVADNTLFENLDYDAFSLDSDFDTDCRVVVECSAPYPATIQALIPQIVTNDRG